MSDEDPLEAFRLSPKALIWYRLMRRYAFPSEDSAVGLSAAREIVRLYEAQRSKSGFDIHEQIVGPTVQWIKERIAQRASAAFFGSDDVAALKMLYDVARSEEAVSEVRTRRDSNRAADLSRALGRAEMRARRSASSATFQRAASRARYQAESRPNSVAAHCICAARVVFIASARGEDQIFDEILVTSQIQLLLFFVIFDEKEATCESSEVYPLASRG